MIITLPKDALKYLDEKIIKVEIDEKILLENDRLSRIKGAKGILKDLEVDGLEYQIKIREELDRSLNDK